MAEETPTTDGEDEKLIREFVQKFSESGGGSGVSLHFDAETARQYRLDPDTEVNVKVCEDEGDVYFRIDAIPAGFTMDKLKEFAKTHNWEEVDARVYDDGDWYLKYQDQSGYATIKMRSKAQIDGALINNVIIESKPIVLSDDAIDQYNAICTAAVRKELDVKIDDSEGLWPRLETSIRHDTDDAPSLETLKQLVEKAEIVTLQLVSRRTSVQTTLEEIAKDVSDIRDVMGEFNSESGYDGFNGSDDPGVDDDGTRQVELSEVSEEGDGNDGVAEEMLSATPDKS